MQEDSPVISSVVADEPSVDPIPAADNYKETFATPQLAELDVEDEPVPKIGKSVSDVLVSDWEDSYESMEVENRSVPEKPKELASATSSASTDCIEVSNEISSSVEAVDQTCTLKTSDVEVNIADAISVTTPAVIQVVEETNVVEASPSMFEQQY